MVCEPFFDAVKSNVLPKPAIQLPPSAARILKFWCAKPVGWASNWLRFFRPQLESCATFVQNMKVMTTTAVQKMPAERLKVAAKSAGGRFVKQSPKLVSREEFLKKYATREDHFKYEWADGVVEKSKRTMNRTQFFILRNLQRFFRELFIAQKVAGELIAEGDMEFAEKFRRPDIMWLTDAQIDRTALDENQVPAFVIEIISTNDAVGLVSKKMGNYRAAGVQVVWQVLPETEEIHVYSGENLDKMTVCQGETICSAAPALPHFQLSAADVFKKPVVD